jgi:UPF0042 nucleotide-binding protein
MSRRVVLVTGLSGAGKGSALHVLEDLGYEAVDNPPLHVMEDLIGRGDRPMAIGVDARSRGFDAPAIIETLARLKLNPALRPELVFMVADEHVLLRRYTETRRRQAVAPLRAAADLVLDTSALSLGGLRGAVEQRFRAGPGTDTPMTVLLISFAFPQGLPLEADLVFDARFLRNPYYDPTLRPLTGLDPEVAAFIEADPDYANFVDKMTDMLSMLLPRFVQEGKKYASVAVGCTGGRHRSVHVVQNLACNLARIRQDTPTWRASVTHRELMRDRSVGWRAESAAAIQLFTGAVSPAQAQEA